MELVPNLLVEGLERCPREEGDSDSPDTDAADPWDAEAEDRFFLVGFLTTLGGG